MILTLPSLYLSSPVAYISISSWASSLVFLHTVVTQLSLLVLSKFRVLYILSCFVSSLLFFLSMVRYGYI